MSKIYSVIVDVAHVESSFKNKKKQMRIDIQEGCMDETSFDHVADIRCTFTKCVVCVTETARFQYENSSPGS